MDFSEETSSDLVLTEANHKYGKTYMLLNNVPVYIKPFKPYSLVTNKFEIPYENIESLVPWLPKVGLYVLGDKATYLAKVNSKQWKKSFCPDWYLEKRILDTMTTQELWKATYHKHIATVAGYDLFKWHVMKQIHRDFLQ